MNFKTTNRSPADLPEEKTVHTERTYFFDVLRTLASLAVIAIHVSVKYWDKVSLYSQSWLAFNLYESISRWAVPIFVMISGALFLGRGLDIKTLYKKYVFRIVTAYFFWALVYAVVNIFVAGSDLADVIAQLINCPDHMWFMFMIPGLYIIVPFLDKIIESPALTKYFLVLSLVFTFLLPRIIFNITELFPKLGSLLSEAFEYTNFHFAVGYVFYFMIGYTFTKTKFSKKSRHLIYIIGVLATAAIFVLTVWISRRKMEATNSYYSYFSVLVMLQSIGLFVFAKHNLSMKSARSGLKKAVGILSKYSFGVYLVHLLILDLSDTFISIHGLMFNSYLAVPAASILIYIISLAISAALNNIPVLKKYTV